MGDSIKVPFVKIKEHVVHFSKVLPYIYFIDFYFFLINLQSIFSFILCLVLISNKQSTTFSPLVNSSH